MKLGTFAIQTAKSVRKFKIIWSSLFITLSRMCSWSPCSKGAELDRRQVDGRLLSLNQANALNKEASKLADVDEKRRLIAKVRDEVDLLNPEFGPKAIERLAGGLSGEEHCLREKLRIEQDNIDALRETTRWPPTYEARFEANQIVVRAPT